MRISGRRIWILLNLVAALMLAACGSSSGGRNAPDDNPPPPSSIATLAALSPSAGSLSPAFDSSTSDYTLLVENSSDSITLSPTATDGGARISVAGEVVESGTDSSDIALSTRETTINVVVTAEDSVTVQAYTVTVTRAYASFELVDPTPGTDDRFGSSVQILANGNVLVSDPRDSSDIFQAGAIHLYSALEQGLINSFYGSEIGQRLGEEPIPVLGNGNFLIVEPGADDGTTNIGSVRLIDGATGEQIGGTVSGETTQDFVGSAGVFVLANGDYVIASPDYDVNGLSDAGSVLLVDGATGEPIAELGGDQAGDALGSSGVTALDNGNFTVASQLDDDGPFVDAGSVRLVDGSNGAQIGAAVFGDKAEDLLGSEGVVELANGNFVISSSGDDAGTAVDAGSVILVDGETGVTIGSPVVGSVDVENLPTFDPTPLPNGNYVVVSTSASSNGLFDNGAVWLVDGSTGAQIGSILQGEDNFDALGSGRVVALSNSNFAVISPFDDEMGLRNPGSVRLVDGTTGSVITALYGESDDDLYGEGAVTELANGNVVVATPNADGAEERVGLVQLFDPSLTTEVNSQAGDQRGDSLGDFPGVIALRNGNYVIAATADDDGAEFGGTVRLMDGTTGDQIGATIVGDQDFDSVGTNVLELLDGSFLVVSSGESDGPGDELGTIRKIDSATGAQFGESEIGESSFDFGDATVTEPEGGDFFVLATPFWDKDGLQDSGRVRLRIY